jgi:site-specific recombinase XerD
MKTQTAIDNFLYSRAAKSDTPATIAWYKIILDYYLTAYPEELPESPEAIERFLLSCKGGDQRRHGFYRTLRCLYRFLYRRKLILTNPIELIDAPRTRRALPRALSTAELYNLLSYPHNSRILAFLTFLADTGARIGELHRLTPADIIKSEFALQAILGHSSFEMLANYRRLRTRQLSEIHAQQSPLRLLPLFKTI